MMRSRLLSVAAIAGVALTVAACGGDDNTSSVYRPVPEVPAVADRRPGSGSSSPTPSPPRRWVDFDTPLMKEAFEKEGLEADIQNARATSRSFATIADA